MNAAPQDWNQHLERRIARERSEILQAVGRAIAESLDADKSGIIAKLEALQAEVNRRLATEALKLSERVKRDGKVRNETGEQSARRRYRRATDDRERALEELAQHIRRATDWIKAGIDAAHGMVALPEVPGMVKTTPERIALDWLYGYVANQGFKAAELGVGDCVNALRAIEAPMPEKMTGLGKVPHSCRGAITAAVVALDDAARELDAFVPARERESIDVQRELLVRRLQQRVYEDGQVTTSLGAAARSVGRAWDDGRSPRGKELTPRAMLEKIHAAGWKIEPYKPDDETTLLALIGGIRRQAAGVAVGAAVYG